MAMGPAHPMTFVENVDRAKLITLTEELNTMKLGVAAVLDAAERKTLHRRGHLEDTRQISKLLIR